MKTCLPSNSTTALFYPPQKWYAAANKFNHFSIFEYRALYGNKHRTLLSTSIKENTDLSGKRLNRGNIKTNSVSLLTSFFRRKLFRRIEKKVIYHSYLQHKGYKLATTIMNNNCDPNWNKFINHTGQYWILKFLISMFLCSINRYQFLL